MAAELDVSAAELLPQTGQMCLLGRIVHVDADSLTATATFSQQSLFCRDGRVGAWISLECMAQAVAAWAGWQGRSLGQPPRIGFLLGTSRFDCLRPWIGTGTALRIRVKKEIQMENGLGQFIGWTYEDGELLASAVITVISPEDPMTIIRAAGNE